MLFILLNFNGVCAWICQKIEKRYHFILKVSQCLECLFIQLLRKVSLPNHIKSNQKITIADQLSLLQSLLSEDPKLVNAVDIEHSSNPARTLLNIYQ